MTFHARVFLCSLFCLWVFVGVCVMFACSDRCSAVGEFHLQKKCFQQIHTTELQLSDVNIRISCTVTEIKGNAVT